MLPIPHPASTRALKCIRSFQHWIAYCIPRKQHSFFTKRAKHGVPRFSCLVATFQAWVRPAPWQFCLGRSMIDKEWVIMYSVELWQSVGMARASFLAGKYCDTLVLNSGQGKWKYQKDMHTYVDNSTKWPLRHRNVVNSIPPLDNTTEL